MGAGQKDVMFNKILLNIIYYISLYNKLVRHFITLFSWSFSGRLVLSDGIVSYSKKKFKIAQGCTN